MFSCLVFFFFKQKTAYEMRISDWSSDVCSSDLAATLMPLPEIQIFGGGAHAGRRVDIQDFLLVCPGAESFAQALDWTAEVYRHAGLLMAESGRLQGVADEGGW